MRGVKLLGTGFVEIWLPLGEENPLVFCGFANAKQSLHQTLIMAKKARI